MENPMSAQGPQQRRAAIERLMSDHTEVDIASMAAHFGVSEMTIRRDFEALEADGVLRRLVGGRAVMVDPKSREPRLSAREDSRHGTKARIGRVAADLIAADEVVFFDGGSTALAVARALRGSGKALTVLTRSLLVAAELADEPGIEIFVLGGRLKASEMATSSSTMADDLQHYNMDTYVMGISGADAVRGLTDYDPDESQGKRLALKRSDRVLLVFDQTKLGRVLMSRVADLEDVDIVVTDADPENEVIKAMPSTVSVVLVDAEASLVRPA
jgi:DeoR/GlpR family transcriptional regulator of sugar metabolism